MRFETRSLSDLRPAEYNPRVPLTPADPEYQSIKRSIEEFGYADPIVINADGTIIKGHQRRTVLMDLGYTEVEVIVLDIQDKTKEKALNVALAGVYSLRSCQGIAERSRPHPEGPQSAAHNLPSFHRSHKCHDQILLTLRTRRSGRFPRLRYRCACLWYHTSGSCIPGHPSDSLHGRCRNPD